MTTKPKPRAKQKKGGDRSLAKRQGIHIAEVQHAHRNANQVEAERGQAQRHVRVLQVYQLIGLQGE